VIGPAARPGHQVIDRRRPPCADRKPQPAGVAITVEHRRPDPPPRARAASRRQARWASQSGHENDEGHPV